MDRAYIEKSFTKQDYNNFIEAFNQRKSYNHYFKDEKQKYEITIYCGECKNGMWKEDFRGSFDCGYGTSGFGYPISVDEIKNITYELLIEKICNQCDVLKKQYQLSLF